MKIEYYGHSCFLITTSAGVRILTDPYTRVGYELPEGLRADIVTVSHEHFDHNYTQVLAYAGVVERGEGARVEKNVRLNGIITSHDNQNGKLRGKNTVFTIEADGLILCHLGDIGETCSPELVQKIGKVDVLLLPVGGNYTIDALEAKRYAEMLQPQTVILMHYRPSDGTIDIATEKSFLELTGAYAEYEGEYQTEEGERVVFMRRKIG